MSAPTSPFDVTVAAQQRAADPAASAWVSANAGSGKTRVLTDRVIGLMLHGADPGAILSITFTRAAAAEMSNRLFRRLGDWAAMPDADLRQNLIELAGEDVGGGYPLAAARRLFARALETPGGLKIQTIHAFAESVLGRFPLEAGLSPEFRVIDDAASADLFEELKQRVLIGVGLDAEAQAALERLLNRMKDQSFDDLLQQTLLMRRLIGSALAREGGLNKLLARLADALGIDADETVEQVTLIVGRDGSFNEIGLRRVVNTLSEDGGKRAVEKATAIADWLASDEDGRADRLDDYRAVWLKSDGDPRSEKDLYPAKALKANPIGLDVMLNEQARILELLDRLHAAEVMARTRDFLSVAVPLLTAYDAAKARRALLDYDDLIDRTLDLLDSRLDWVHFKLDQGVQHILIDEAQDTSPEQWRIAERLSAEFFTGEGIHANQRTVFAVGDEKQSIYSFQGADPEGFDRMRQKFRGLADQALGTFADEKLELSFRSTPAILTAVDAVFAGPAGLGLTASGAAVTHAAMRVEAAGVVELWPLDEPDAAAEPERWKAPVDAEPETSTRRRLAWRIARRIRQMLDDGETVRVKDSKTEEQRPITPGDVLILVRSRDALVDEIARALKSPEIDVPLAGSDRMALTEQIAVMDLMALGDFLLLPDDDLSLAIVLKSPFFGWDDDDLFRLAHPREKGTPLWRALRERGAEDPKWEAARAELAELLGEVDQASPHDFYSTFLAARGGRRRLHARLGPDQMDPLDEFLNAALEDERDNPPSLQGFLHRLRHREAEIKRDMEQGLDAVRIMTVHGAKGLEAPIVFLPDTIRPARGEHGGLMRFPVGEDVLPVISVPRAEQPDRMAQALQAAGDRRLAEYYRQLYVAMTRAEDRLYIAGYYNSPKRKPADEGWYRVVEAALQPIAEAVEDGILRVGAAPKGRLAPDEAPAPPSLPSWLDQPPPEEPTPPRPLVPSRVSEGHEPAEASPLRPQTGGAGRRRGTLIHRLLQVLPDAARQEREVLGARLLARQAADIAEPERAQWLAEALAVLDDPDLAAVFAPGSRPEVPVTGLVGQRVVTGQIDRLAVTDDAVWIADFKTNRPPPADVADTPAAYLAQMALYREVLRQIHPAKPVRAALVWTYETRAMAIPDSMLDTALASLDLSGGGF